MNSIKLAVFAAALAGAFAGSLYEVDDAAAWGIRRSAVECHIDGDTSQGRVLGGRIMNPSDSNSVFLYCPTPEDALVNGASIKTINVHGYSSSETEKTYAAVCDQSYADDFFGCSNQVETAPGGGDFALQLGAPVFSQVFPPALEAHFKFVTIRLARRKANSQKASTLRGIFYAG